ncbi:MAG: hypothetical protein KDE27_03320, partial [Planctomycetes bacterium]|nr:hypothetical protein [Planctomycetota bacterium]
PDPARADELLAALEGLAPGNAFARRFAAVERALRAGRQPAGDPGATLALHNAWLAERGAMPFLVPGYAALLERALADSPDRELALARLPRHPLLGQEAVPVAAFPGLEPELAAALYWQPPRAAGFDLPRALGGRCRLADRAGKPLLVVFFLGFG